MTAVTAQHTAGVAEVVPLDPAFVVAQVEAVVTDLAPAVAKTGMLATPATVAAVAGLAARGRLANLVVDPVLVSTSGFPLMADGVLSRPSIFSEATPAWTNSGKTSSPASTSCGLNRYFRLPSGTSLPSETNS